MVISRNDNALELYTGGARPLDKGYLSLNQINFKDLSYIDNRCRQNFYPFYGTASIRRTTRIHHMHKNNRKKKVNRKSVVSNNVKTAKKLDGIMADNKRGRKSSSKTNWKRAY